MEKWSTHFLFRGSPGLIKWMKTMKLIIVLLVMSAGTLFANVSAQDMKLDLRVEQKSLVEIMDLLKQKSGFSFIYSAGDVENITGISISVADKTIREILNLVLKGTNLVFSIEKDLIILKQAPAQQEKQRILTGVVIGQAKDTLPGVTVLIKGTSKGVVTDHRGKYTIMLPAGDHLVLCFSFIGKKTKEVKYTGQKTLNVTLEDDTQAIDEVVITGYQRIEKRYLTSAVTTIKAEDILMPGMTTIDKMLEGHVPGMIFMQNSGQVGATPRLRIRGSSTVLGSQEPLWVVDGIVQTDPVNVDPAQLNDLDFVNLLGNAISGLNPNDIEQIDVLKDASATALYGTQAGNGVIVITTKQGKVGPPSVTYNVTGTYTQRPHYTERAINMMNSKERVDYSREIYEKRLTYKNVNAWVGYEKALNEYRNSEINYDDFQKQVTLYETMNTDWFDILCQNSISHNHTLSFSGGAPSVKYYASVGYGRSDGVLKKEFGDRYTTNLKISLNHNKFNAQFMLNGNVRKDEHTPSEVKMLDYAYNSSRAIPAYNEDGSLWYYPVKMDGSSLEQNYNVLNERDNSYQKINGNTLGFKVNLGYRFTEALKLETTFAYSVSSTVQETYFAENTAYVGNIQGRQWKTGTSNPNSTELPFGGELKRDQTDNKNLDMRVQLNYNKFLDASKRHLIMLSVGGQVNSVSYGGFRQTLRCYMPERGMLISPFEYTKYPKFATWMSQDPAARGVLKDELANKISGYGTLSYSYNDFYVFNVNMRIDASNKFGEKANDQLLPVWSVSGRWNTKADILQNVNWVSDLALRASFGYQGNMTGQSPELIIRKGGLNSMFDEYESDIQTFPNPNLSWEKSSSLTGALEFSLFQNKLKGNVSYFYKKTENAFLAKKVSAVNGTTVYTVNKGTVENQGLEFSFNITPVNTSVSGTGKGFRWSIDPQLGQVVNKLINKATKTKDYDPLHDKYTYTDYLNGTANVSGRPLNSFYSYEFTGLSPVNGLPSFARTEEENYEIYGEMKNEKVFTTVMKYSGCRVPYLQGGIMNTFAYNRFMLSFNLAYSIGSKIRLLKLYPNPTGSILPRPEINARREFINRWQNPGDELHTNIPGLMKASDENATKTPWWFNEPYKFAENIWQMYNDSDLRVVSGDYVKLQSLSLRYSFSEEMCKKMRLSSLYLSLSGTNLFTLSHKALKGQDPTSQSGSANGINLSVRPSYSFSMNVTF